MSHLQPEVVVAIVFNSIPDKELYLDFYLSLRLYFLSFDRDWMDQLVGPDWGWPRYHWRASSLINNNKSCFKWKLVGKNQGVLQNEENRYHCFFYFAIKESHAQ